MKHSLIAGDAWIASGIPFTNRFGTMLREEGAWTDEVIRSALPIASSVSCIGFTLAGLRRMRWIARAASGNPSLTFHTRTIRQVRLQYDVGRRCGEDSAARRKDVRRVLDGFRKVAGQRRQGGDEREFQTVAFQSLAGVETILKQSRQHGFVFRERHQAVADIAWRQTWRNLDEAGRNCHRHRSR